MTLIDESVPRTPTGHRCRRFYLFLSIAVLLGTSHPMLYGENLVATANILQVRLEDCETHATIGKLERDRLWRIPKRYAPYRIDDIRIQPIHGFLDKFTGGLFIPDTMDQIKLSGTINYVISGTLMVTVTVVRKLLSV